MKSQNYWDFIIICDSTDIAYKKITKYQLNTSIWQMIDERIIVFYKHATYCNTTTYCTVQ